MTQVPTYQRAPLAGDEAQYHDFINGVVQAILTQAAGATEPTETYGHMLWLDTSGPKPVLRRRNAANSGWTEVELEVATEVQARAGTANNVVMTPLGTALAIESLAGKPDVQEFPLDGTWVKPTGFPETTPVNIKIWGPGGSGGRQDSSSDGAGGGGGGGFVWIRTQLRYLDATEAVDVGLGAIGRTNDGNGSTGSKPSAFKAVRVSSGNGGGTGDFSEDDPAPGGTGGRLISDVPVIFELVTSETGGAGGTMGLGGAGPIESTVFAGAGGGGGRRAGTDYYQSGGTSTYGGDGGNGSPSGFADAPAGRGGGGGAGTTGAAGSGADGFVEVVVG